MNVLRPQPFQNMPTSSDIIRFGTNEVKFIDRDPHWYTRRVKEAIHIRLHPNNIKRDSGIEIPEGWMPTIKQHNSRSVPQRTREGTASSQNNEDRNPPTIARIEMHQSKTATMLLIMRHSQSTSSPDDLNMKTGSKRSKSRDPRPCDNIVRQTINKLSSVFHSIFTFSIRSNRCR